MTKVFKTDAPEATQLLAKRLGQLITEPCTLLLEGDLGSGKTTFTQGLALGLDIHQKVSSPSFTIMKNYQGRLNLNHIDAYRLETSSLDLGFEEYIQANGVTVIEWPQFVKTLWPISYIYIRISMLEEDCRQIELTALGAYEQYLLENL
jgi:tRNA threonylcarbamoyladenosine biosynthesis protein TsaE